MASTGNGRHAAAHITTARKSEVLIVGLAEGGASLEFRGENARLVRRMMGRGWLTALDAHELGLTSDLPRRVVALKARGLDIRARPLPGRGNWRYRPRRYRLATKLVMVWDSTVDGPREPDRAHADDARLLVATIPRNGEERLEISLCRFLGHNRVDVRAFRVATGEATPRGVSLPVEQLPAMLSGLWELFTIAVASGLLKGVAAPWLTASTSRPDPAGPPHEVAGSASQ